MRIDLGVARAIAGSALVVVLVAAGAAPFFSWRAATSTGPSLAVEPGESSPLAANFTYRVDGATCPTNGEVTNSVTLNGTASGGVQPYTFYWTLPTGSATGPEAMTTTTYGGNNSVTLRVDDSANHTAIRSEILQVVLPPCPPVFNDRGTIQALEIALVTLVVAGCFGLGVLLWHRRRRRKSSGFATEVRD